MRGSPIRKSSDQRSVDSSPRLIAASYVLHRLLVPRHPPCALNNLTTQKSHPTHPRKEAMRRAYKNSANQSQKMLASTVQFSTYDQTPPPCPRQTPASPRGTRRYEKQDGPDTKQQTTRHTPGSPGRNRDGPLPQDPTACLPPTLTHHTRSTPRRAVLAAADDAGRTGQRSTLEHHPRCVQPVESDGPS